MNTQKRLARFQRNRRLSFIACVGVLSLSGCTTSQRLTDAVPQQTSIAADEVVQTATTSTLSNNDTKEASAADGTQQDQQSKSTSQNTRVSYQTTVAVVPPVDLEAGITYAEARTRLIQQGWIPSEAPDPGPYGVERTLYDVGFTEVSACAGTGLGQCRFDFYHPNRATDNLLSVTTYGGSRPEVAAWSTQSGNANHSSAASSIEDATQSLSEIPVPFRGRWMTHLEDCSASYTSDGRLLIESDLLQFYESSGPVLEVTQQGDSEITVTTELSSEGTTFVETDTFRLSGEGSILTDVDTGGVRYRCPDM